MWINRDIAVENFVKKWINSVENFKQSCGKVDKYCGKVESWPERKS